MCIRARDCIGKYDAILVAPQIRYQKKMLEKLAAPYEIKIADIDPDVYKRQLTGKQETDEFSLMQKLADLCGVAIPLNLAKLNELPIRHENHLAKEAIQSFVEKKLGEKEW